MVKVSIIGKGYWGSVIDKNINDMVEYVEPKDADWIIISTPNDLHHEQVEYWLSQRKNVFCEKPLTLTKRSAEALFSLADFFGVKLYFSLVLPSTLIAVGWTIALYYQVFDDEEI